MSCTCRYVVAAGAIAALSTTLMGSLLPQVFVIFCALSRTGTFT